MIIYLVVLGISLIYTLIFWHTQLIIQHFMLCTSKPGTFLKFYHISLRKSFLSSCYVIKLQTELSMLSLCSLPIRLFKLFKIWTNSFTQKPLNPIKRQTMYFDQSASI